MKKTGHTRMDDRKAMNEYKILIVNNGKQITEHRLIRRSLENN